MSGTPIRSILGGRICFAAQPVAGWSSAVIGAIGFAHRSTEWATRRWAPRFLPIVRLARVASLVAVAAFAWAGAGIRCLRIGGRCYVRGVWFHATEVADVVGPGAPHPMYRRSATTIVLRSGRSIGTDLDLETVRELLGIRR